MWPSLALLTTTCALFSELSHDCWHNTMRRAWDAAAGQDVAAALALLQLYLVCVASGFASVTMYNQWALCLASVLGCTCSCRRGSAGCILVCECERMGCLFVWPQMLKVGSAAARG
jgi:hypothetical protein